MQGRVVVVGAGAAGIIAAWNASREGAQVTLLEKTDRLGTKILISGGGKCNITHDGPIEDVLKAFRKNEALFIRPACYRFRNYEVVDMLTSRGLEVYTRPDGRVFPVHQTAKDVVAILESYLQDECVDVRMNTPVRRIRVTDGKVAGVETDLAFLPSEHVVLATGGSSYPKSGTTGDGWPWARAAGHTIVPVRPALAPMELVVDGAPLKAGVALRDTVLKARLAPPDSHGPGREIARWRGDLLFTHRGVSGPTVLGISRDVAEQERLGTVTLEVDLLPDETFETVSARVRSWCEANPKKGLARFPEGLVPASLEDDLLAAAGLTEDVRAAQAAKRAVNRLVETLKGWPLGKVREVVLAKGEVVAGGVSLDEVDPQTMRSLRCPGLYLCGEVLDIAGPVGGYNLQAAFATGFVAGETAARDAQGR